MAPSYKLTYFNGRGLAEPIRLIFALKGIEFEDVRIEKENWPEQKSKLNLPFSQVPILEFDGVVLAQSRAIARYLANEHGLAGKDAVEHAKADMVVDGVFDVFAALNKFRFEADETKREEFKKTLLEETVPKAIKNFSDILNGNGTGHFVGDAVTWADLVVAYGLETLHGYLPTLLDEHLELKKFNDAILGDANIKAYLDKRPVTEF